ncbi:MAG: hypothetical protein WBK27_01875 [Bacteroidales bacterium]|jgi:hypothetical protein|nr:hypothetical protein [Bacteroidales bacterium]
MTITDIDSKRYEILLESFNTKYLAKERLVGFKTKIVKLISKL